MGSTLNAIFSTYQIASFYRRKVYVLVHVQNVQMHIALIFNSSFSFYCCTFGKDLFCINWDGIIFRMLYEKINIHLYNPGLYLGCNSYISLGGKIVYQEAS